MEIERSLREDAGRVDVGRGYAAGLASAAILSTTAVFIRYLTEEYGMQPLALAMWRSILVAATLTAVLGLWRPRLLRVAPGDVRPLLLWGLVLALFNGVWTISVALNGAAVATVLAYSSPAFTVALGRWFLRERLSWPKLAAVALCIAGCVLVAGLLDETALRLSAGGIAAGVLSGLGYAVYSLVGRATSARGVGAWTMLLYTFGFAALFLLLINVLGAGFVPGAARDANELLWRGAPAVGWGILFLLAAGPTVLGFGAYNLSLSLLPSSVANLIVTLEPAFTAAIAYLLLDERFTAAQVGGGLLIVLGVVVLRVGGGGVEVGD